MSVNQGGWTLFYKNSNLSPVGESYNDMLLHPEGFLMAGDDITDDSVVGLSPLEGLRPVSLMAVPVDAMGSAFSAVYFEDVDVASSIVEMTDVIPGCNEYSSNFRIVETYAVSQGCHT